MAGSVMGSPQYLSPEQIRGEELDGRSDIFSLGVVLYELLSSKRPFDGETITTLVYQILHKEPPPVSELRQIPERLEQLLRRMLAKDRDERFATAAEVAARAGGDRARAERRDAVGAGRGPAGDGGDARAAAHRIGLGPAATGARLGRCRRRSRPPRRPSTMPAMPPPPPASGADDGAHGGAAPPGLGLAAVARHRGGDLPAAGGVGGLVPVLPGEGAGAGRGAESGAESAAPVRSTASASSGPRRSGPAPQPVAGREPGRPDGAAARESPRPRLQPRGRRRSGTSGRRAAAGRSRRTAAPRRLRRPRAAGGPASGRHRSAPAPSAPDEPEPAPAPVEREPERPRPVGGPRRPDRPGAGVPRHAAGRPRAGGRHGDRHGPGVERRQEEPDLHAAGRGRVRGQDPRPGAAGGPAAGARPARPAASRRSSPISRRWPPPRWTPPICARSGCARRSPSG